jgi:hypothetical protein
MAGPSLEPAGAQQLRGPAAFLRGFDAAAYLCSGQVFMNEMHRSTPESLGVSRHWLHMYVGGIRDALGVRWVAD